MLPTRAPAAASGAIVVSADGRRVSLDVAGTALRQSLERIASQAGFVLSHRGPLDAPVTLRLDDVPVTRALAILLGDRSRLLRFAPAASGGSRRLVSVCVHDRSGDRTVTFRPPTAAMVGAAADYPTPDDEREALRAVARSARLPGDEAVLELTSQLELGESAQARQAAAQALGRIGTPAALRALSAALRDDDAIVRSAGLRELGAARGAHAARQLAMVLDRSPEPAMRVQAARHLGNHPGPLTRAALEAALGDPDPTVRSAADQSLAFLLAASGTPSANGEEP